MEKPCCPHCERPAPIRVEEGDGEFRQTVQCDRCWKLYRVVVTCRQDECVVRTEGVDADAA